MFSERYGENSLLPPQTSWSSFFFNLNFSGSNSDEEECEDIISFSGPPLSASMLRVEAFLDDIISGKCFCFCFCFIEITLLN